jgi:hypothetical protein
MAPDRGLWKLLATLWRGPGMVAIRFRLLVLRPGLRMVVSRWSTLGLVAISLWRLVISSGSRLGLEPDGILWRRRLGTLAPGNRSVDAVGWRHCGYRAFASSGYEGQNAAELIGRIIRSDISRCHQCSFARDRRALESGKKSGARRHAKSTGAGSASSTRLTNDGRKWRGRPARGRRKS